MKYRWTVGGMLLTALVALAAQQLIRFSPFTVFGALVSAILLGMAVRAAAGERLASMKGGFAFAAKFLLRLGIVLMGVRLNLADIAAAGWRMVALDGTVIVFALTVIHLLGKRLAVGERLTSLIAIGTGVCGAAAIGAAAQAVRAKDEEVALSVTLISLLGTAFTVLYTLLQPVLAFSAQQYGVFVGATLHEIAHVVAAAAPAGASGSDQALLVKLGRVILLAPVVMALEWRYRQRASADATDANTNTGAGLPDGAAPGVGADEGIGARVKTPAPIPWFVVGFLAMALLNTYHCFSPAITAAMVSASLFLMAMAMAGMGLNVWIGDFKRVGVAPVLLGVSGSVLLSLFGRFTMAVLSL
ncbi:putative sulfate exporter family transporter [Heliobacterium gestii]|uniref:Putative sulfate exporter family transporter n=1 Tax=Heliomicrobium gestii TaxID=2699 RepID=A0A845LFH7_HELGE|nr:putative sulfate exporter family transporter [Heliomicrobium gestii]MBM7866524.1 putative integral membrane protein (TIGR00698 family) [Heliomicrobium gestii]MZP43195.1 putative sulfate exporter family transporter [Heliomicrobium gestii]